MSSSVEVSVCAFDDVVASYEQGLEASHQTARTCFRVVQELTLDTGAGGLAAANQIYNRLKSQGNTLRDGDIAIVDVSFPSCCCD